MALPQPSYRHPVIRLSTPNTSSTSPPCVCQAAGWVCQYHGLTAHARHRLPSVFYACGSIDARLHANPSEPCLRVRVLSAANPSCWLMSGRTSARSTLSTVHLTCLDESRMYGTSDIRPHYNLARRTIAHKCSVPCRLRTHFAYTEEPCRALSAVLCE